MGKRRGPLAAIKEALKCCVVCANCHAMIEAGRIPSPPPWVEAFALPEPDA